MKVKAIKKPRFLKKFASKLRTWHWIKTTRRLWTQILY